jgi:hypothetical protein
MIGKFRRCKLPGTDQIPEEVIQAEGETLFIQIKSNHSFIHFIYIQVIQIQV